MGRLRWRHIDQQIAEQMRSEGASYTSIAASLGRRIDLVREKLNPDIAQRRRELDRAKYLRNREAYIARAKQWCKNNREVHNERAKRYASRKAMAKRLFPQKQAEQVSRQAQQKLAFPPKAALAIEVDNSVFSDPVVQQWHERRRAAELNAQTADSGKNQLSRLAR